MQLWMASIFHLLLLFQPAESQPAGSPLLGDADVQAALQEAMNSKQPHHNLLAESIIGLLEENRFPAADMKLAILSVLRYSHSSKDPQFKELYLRLLQQPVITETLSALEAAEKIKIDCQANDWPKKSLLNYPAPESKPVSKDQGILASFGAVRGDQALYVIFQTRDDQQIRQLEPTKLVYTIEISKLSNRYRQADYSINIVGDRVRLYDQQGQEIPSPDQSLIEVRQVGRILELKIPFQYFEEDLRSIIVRGFLADPKTQKTYPKTPWIACPTGPISSPLEMLLFFASKQELPSGTSLPLAIAYQEGLLLQHSSSDLAEQIRADAYEWFKFAMDLSDRMELQGLPLLSQLPITAQLAWSCRYDDVQALDSMDDYQFHVPSPQTLADMRGYVEVQGWLKESSASELGQKIAELMSKRFKMFDYPDESARSQGQEFVDSRADAYVVKGKEKFLCYRDLGINRRWKLFEEGFDPKGNQSQAIQFQRALTLATGLPSVWAYHRMGTSEHHYALYYQGQTQKWLTLGAPALETMNSTSTDCYFAWGRPWSRPERGDFWELDVTQLPTGSARWLLSGDAEKTDRSKLAAILEKGLTKDQFSKMLWPMLSTK